MTKKTIGIMTLGTRGDIQPFIALAKALDSEGYTAVLCTSPGFEGFVLSQGVRCRPLRADYMELASTEKGGEMMNGNPLAVIKALKSTIIPMIRRSLTDTAQVSRDFDAIICHPKAFGAYDIAQLRNIPVITVSPAPVVEAVSEFANPAFFCRSFGPYINRMTYSLNSLVTASFSGAIREWRARELGLTAKRPKGLCTYLNGGQIPVIYPISPLVLYDLKGSGRFCVSGYWWLEEEEYIPDKELAAFVEDKPPVCIGFGSISVKNPAEFSEMLISAAVRLGEKTVILSGQNAFYRAGGLPGSILIRESVPHNWLFPRVRAAVHHGGAGTASVCMRYGVPQIVCPVMGDQPFWAERMKKLGVCSHSIPQKKLTAEALCIMLSETISDVCLKENAERLANGLRQENGLETAVQFINKNIMS